MFHLFDGNVVLKNCPTKIVQSSAVHLNFSIFLLPSVTHWNVNVFTLEISVWPIRMLFNGKNWNFIDWFLSCRLFYGIVALKCTQQRSSIVISIIFFFTKRNHIVKSSEKIESSNCNELCLWHIILAKTVNQLSYFIFKLKVFSLKIILFKHCF